MSELVQRYRTRSTRETVAILVCTAVSDLAVALVAVANPDVAAVAVGTIATLTTAGIAAAASILRPS